MTEDEGYITVRIAKIAGDGRTNQMREFLKQMGLEVHICKIDSPVGEYLLSQDRAIMDIQPRTDVRLRDSSMKTDLAGKPA